MSTSSDHPTSADLWASRAERGVSFVEIVVSIVIVGTATIALLTALVAATAAAAARHDASVANAALTAAGSAITDDGTQFVPCATVSDPDYAAAIRASRSTDPAAPTVAIDAIEHWDSALSGPDGRGDWSATCDGRTRLQRIRLEATVDGEVRTLAVVKRRADSGGSGG